MWVWVKLGLVKKSAWSYANLDGKLTIEDSWAEKLVRWADCERVRVVVKDKCRRIRTENRENHEWKNG